MKSYNLVLPLMLAMATFAEASYDPCKDSSTNGTKQCLSNQLDAAEIKMDKVYNEAIAQAKKRDAERVQDNYAPLYPANELENRVASAQSTWVQYHVANCDLVAADFLGGTGETVLNLGCLVQSTKNRIKELQKLKRHL